jgi:hypothetical protein
MKEKLNKCVTWQDSQDVLKDTPKEVIREFINALETAKEFIDLTMRDEFLLSQAVSYLQYH